MLKIKQTACIDASVTTTWNYLSDLENISLWSEPVLSSQCNGTLNKGVGAERVCYLKNNITITERWLDWQEGKSFTYEGFNLPLVKSAKNTWSIKTQNGKTLLTTEATVVLKGGIFAKILEPLMLMMSKKMGSDALSAFKYLVENGKPFEGKHASLPRVPTIC